MASSRSVGWRVPSAPARVPRAIGAAAARFVDHRQFGAAIRYSGNDHAVMDQCVEEAGDGRFIARARASGNEDARDLANQFALCPQATGLVEEVAHLGGHVAEPGRRPEDDRVVVRQFLRAGNGGRLVCLDVDLLLNVFGHQLWDAFDDDLGARHGPRAFGDCLGHGLDVAPSAVIEDENLRHGVTPSVVGSGLCAIRSLSFHHDRLSSYCGQLR